MIELICCRLKLSRAQCSKCARELDSDSERSLCPTCHTRAKSSPLWRSCKNKDIGCLYGSEDEGLLNRHQWRRCRYWDWRCFMCGEENTNRDKTRIHHRIQNHCRELAPDITGDSATVTVTVTMGSDTWSYYTMCIHSVKFLVEIYTAVDAIHICLTSDTERWGGDIFTCKYKIESWNSRNVVNGELLKKQNFMGYSYDCYNHCKTAPFQQNSKIRITLFISA